MLQRIFGRSWHHFRAAFYGLFQVTQDELNALPDVTPKVGYIGVKRIFESGIPTTHNP